MGFLTGAFGKSLTHRQLLNIQHEKANVHRQLYRIQRQVSRQEKFDARELSAIKQAINTQKQAAKAKLQAELYESFQGQYSSDSTDEMKNQNMYMTSLNQGNAEIDLTYENQLNTIIAAKEDEQQMRMDALKDIEQDLQMRKDSLESQEKILEGQLAEYKKEEEAGAKELIGGGNRG